jgi:hypothetical protein
MLLRAHKAKYDVYQVIQSISPNQIKCKLWLVEELSRLPVEFPNIQLYGGWYGFPLIDFLLEEFDINLIQNIDLDEEAIAIYNMHVLRRNLKTKLVGKITDASNRTRYDKFIDLVINTSSEHMPDLPVLIKDKKYKKECVFALQSNNMFHHSDHINCVNNVQELIKKSGLRKILYSGTLDIDEYERYMVIGLV